MLFALAASLISIRTGISVALVEIAIGVVAGNLLHLQATEWIKFLAAFGSVLLTFLAGAEIEPEVLRRRAKESFGIGIAGFLFPFAGVALLCYCGLGWTRNAALVGGIALSTTSVAVVYAVMVETGLNKTELGKVILAGCFINDLATVLALGAIFANYNLWLVAFLGGLGAVVLAAPALTRHFLTRFGTHVSEAGIKLIFVLLFGLGALAARANSEAVLGAYVLGLVLATVLAGRHDEVRHLRTTAFALLTPFYFLRAGMLVSVPAVWMGAGVVGLLLAVKMLSKAVGIAPLTAIFRFGQRTATYTVLLMSTGLTFGTISALFGYTRGIISRSQYSFLVAAVIGSAVVPTIIAERFFRPPHDHAENFLAHLTKGQEAHVAEQTEQEVSFVPEDTCC